MKQVTQTEFASRNPKAAADIENVAIKEVFEIEIDLETLAARHPEAAADVEGVAIADTPTKDWVPVATLASNPSPDRAPVVPPPKPSLIGRIGRDVAVGLVVTGLATLLVTAAKALGLTIF